ncbi:MAG: hypothetical protein R6X25_04190 [Candidatus Krumholzibacteriia bacterium]
MNPLAHRTTARSGFVCLRAALAAGSAYTGRAAFSTAALAALVALTATAALTATPALGQDARFGERANPADLEDPFAPLVNPALGEISTRRLAAGYRLLHLDFLGDISDLQAGGAVYAGRSAFTGLVAGWSGLDTPLSSEQAGRLGLGRELGRGFVAGFGAGFVQQSFRRGRFVLEDAFDPLLQGSLTSTAATLSFGLTWWRPRAGLTAAVVVDNPHEPDVSLQGDGSAVLRRTTRAGAAWRRDRWQLHAALAHDAWLTRWSAGGRAFLAPGHALGASVSDVDWSVSARVAVGEALWVEYVAAFARSELADASSGTHGLAVCWLLGGPVQPRSTRPGTPPAIGETAPPADRGTASGFTVAAPRDTLRLRTKRLRRIIAPGVDAERLAQLARWQVGVLDTSGSDDVILTPGAQVPAEAPAAERPQVDYADDYRQRVAELGRWLREHPGETVVVVAPADQLDRARDLAEQVARFAGRDEGSGSGVEIRVLPAPPSGHSELARLLAPAGPGPWPDTEQIALREFDPVPFTVQPVDGTPPPVTASWTLAIMDHRNGIVRRLEGQGTPPETVLWDWRDDHGVRRGRGEYRYQLSWRGADGIMMGTPPSRLLVVEEILQRTLTFETGRGPLELSPAGAPKGVRPTLIISGDPAPARQDAHGGD